MAVSAMARRPRPSTKQHIRIWFEFYKLALADGRYSAALDASRSYYEPWGDVDGVTFDRWWETHSHLFDELRVREVGAIEPNPALLYLAVPLDLETKRVLLQVRDVVAARQRASVEQIGGRSGRSNRVGVARFGLTPGVEFRGTTADVVLRIYRDVYLPAGMPPIGAAFALEVARFFRSPRTSLKIQFLPPSLSDAKEVTQDQLRNLRRYIKRAQALMEAAANGDFPGRARLG